MDHTYEDTFIPLTSINSGHGQELAQDLYYVTIQIVNVCFAGFSDSGDWVLIDAGMPGAAERIVREAEKRFGLNNAPKAIILTHGHFDHVGSVEELVKHWNAPVYAHELELPYLTGKMHYPPGDSTVDGGLVSELSPWFPHHGIDLGDRVNKLNANGSITEMPEWRFIHTPGHTPGHVSLFRDKDRLLIAGDAFVTVKQESLYKVVTQHKEISGPPKYFTTDWEAARESVNKLQALQPFAAVTGHGEAMAGDELANNLALLVKNFDSMALPEKGRFVH